MTLQTERLRTMERVGPLWRDSEPVDYKPKDQTSAYAFVRRTLARFYYRLLGRVDRGCVRAYIGKARLLAGAELTGQF